MAHLDDVMRLVGDEDCGVGIDCRICDRGGAPIAYYQHPPTTGSATTAPASSAYTPSMR